MSDTKDTAARRGLSALLEALRPQHWVKNGFVLAPIVFGRRYDAPDAWGQAGLAVAAFCLLASAVYLVNDIRDRNADLAHPDKRNRPIPSGRLSVGAAGVAAIVLVLAGAGLVALVRENPFGPRLATGNLFVLWAGLYLAQGFVYSLWLKRVPIVDVMLVAFGFVLRAIAGAAAIGVPTSPWLVLCTFTLCLYIALSKRRGEIEQLPDGAAIEARPANRGYKPGELDRMLTISAALAIMTYCLYCVAPRTIEVFGSANMIWTVPLVLYGVFRYDRTSRRRGRGDVVSVLLADRKMWLVVLAYVLLAGVVVKYGGQPPLRDLLDVMH